MSNYTANTIKTLDYFEHIRQYPGMYIGSVDIRGLHHCVKEIISNSIDEWLNGAGDTITVSLLPNNGIKIEDNGRGIPHGKHESGCSVLQACYGIANTGGKFDNATGKTGYNSSGGEHGTGGKAVNALSTKMIVTTALEGKKEIVEFSKGEFISYKEEDSSKHGVTVTFYPDADIFETIEFDVDKLREMIREFSFLCKGLTFIFNTLEGTETYKSEKGLYDYLQYLNKDKTFLCNPFYINARDGGYQIEIALGYNSNYTSSIKLYTNNIPQEKGTHLTGFKTAWTLAVNNFAKEKKWLKDGEKLSGADLEEGMLLILNFKMIDPIFKGQNKEELSSSEGRTYVQKLTTETLKELLPYQEKDIKVIVDKALAARKAREAAKKARDAARAIDKKKKEKVLKFDSKLADCYSKDRKKCEIYIVEGDSASGNIKLARDNEFQAVLPVRGKILNTRKATLEQIQKNAEIMTMIEAFGLTIDVKTMKVTYRSEDLRYGKIIIMSDGDIDGSHIKNLFYTFIWTFCPELISEGYIYAGVPPLYKITIGKEYKYLKNDAELEEFRKANPKGKYLVNRLKGLGEMSADETEETLTDPANRIIKQITVEDIEGTNKLFDDLMGTSSIPRKEYIKNHSEEAEGDI